MKQLQSDPQESILMTITDAFIIHKLVTFNLYGEESQK